MNKNCYHLDGPTGVKYATQRIKQVLQSENHCYVIRADIKSFYASIPYFKLIQDIKKYYNDPKLITMLENIITNPIDTPRGMKNPSKGIALRGPLSQFFSGLYLKPLDDAFNNMNVTYLRFQDDILILCKTKRQLTRCRQRMMQILNERHLSLSRKKTRIGNIDRGFHFLGISYLPTQPVDNTINTHVNDDQTQPTNIVHDLNTNGGGRMVSEHQNMGCRMVPHPRTLRKAREQVKAMVNDGVSLPRIRNYLHRFVLWWQKTSTEWSYQNILRTFVSTCKIPAPAGIAADLFRRATSQVGVLFQGLSCTIA